MSHYLTVFKYPNISSSPYLMFRYFDISQFWVLRYLYNLPCRAVKQFPLPVSHIYCQPQDEYLKYTQTMVFFLEFIQSKYVAPVQWYKIGLVKLQKHTKTRDFRTNALDMSNRLQESWTDFENYKETVGQRSRKLPETIKKSQEFP